MLEQLDGLSYTIPFLNVTITKDVVLEYARTHTQNGGPVFSIVLLVLFGLIMTLVWIYLALCAFCCSLKRAATPHRISPRSPGGSPVSPSRSSAPLRRAGDKRSSPRSYPGDDEYADGGIEMGGGGDRGGAPGSPYGLGRAASWERERRRYSFRCLYVCSGLFSVILLVCVLGVFAAQSKFDGSVRMLAQETEDLILSGADALCTSSEYTPRTCTPRSVGTFVTTAENQTTSILDDTLGLVSSLGDRVLPYVNATVDELEAARVQLMALQAAAGRINANVTEIEQYRAWLVDAADPAVAGEVPQGALPRVTDEQLQAVDDAMANMDESVARANDVYTDVTDFVATQLPQLEAELNPDNGTTARQLLDPLEQVLAAIFDARDRTMRFHDQTQDGEEMYGGYLTQKTWAVTIVFLVPLLLQVILTLMNRSYPKCSGHLIAHMCCSYACLLLFTLTALVFAALAAVSSTVCEYHLQAIDRVPPQNFTINDVQLSLTPAVIKAVLTCPAGPVATAYNNFVSLLPGAEQLFNVTDEAETALAQIDEARGSFSPEAQIRLALLELEEMGNATTGFNVTEAAASLPEYQQEVADLLADLPPEPLDRLNATQQDRLLHYYLASQTNPQFDWDAYATNIAAVDAVLATADPTTPLPPGFEAVNTLQTMHNFTRATVQANLAAWQDVDWTGGNTLQTLEARLQATDPYTDAVNDAEAANIEVRANVTAMYRGLGFVGDEVGEVDEGQTALAELQRSVNNTLHALLAEVQAVEAALDTEAGDVRELAAYVGTAPEYTKCGWVGDFYKDGFKEAFCGNFHTSASITWPFMLGAAFCLFVSFLAFSCFVRKPDWYMDPGYEDGMERNNLTPGRTPHGGAYIVA